MTPGQQATQAEFERRTRSRQAKFGYSQPQAQLWSFLEMACEAAGLWQPPRVSRPAPRPSVPAPTATAASAPPRGRPVAAPRPEPAPPTPAADQLALPGTTSPRRWTP